MDKGDDDDDALRGTKGVAVKAEADATKATRADAVNFMMIVNVVVVVLLLVALAGGYCYLVLFP